MKTLLNKLQTIQNVVVTISKDTKGHNYKYTSGSKILDRIKPLMKEYKLLLVPEMGPGKITPITVKNKNGKSQPKP